MRILRHILLLLVFSFFFAEISSQVYINNKQVEKNIEVSVSFSNGGRENQIRLHCGIYATDIKVVITNLTDTIASFYEDWNEWGYFNMRFQIITRDSVYEVYRKPRGWNKNYPSFVTLYPKDSLVLNYNFREQDCPWSEFEGLPQTNLSCAKIRVVYQLNSARHLSSLEFRSIEWYYDRKGTKTPAEIFRSFPAMKLISKYYEIIFNTTQNETIDL